MYDKENRFRPRWHTFVAYLLLLLLCIGALVGLRNCSSRGVIVSPERSGESSGDTIDVAMLYAPLNYYMYDDTLGGYSYDLLRLISKTERQPINIIPVTSIEDALAGMQGGRFDLVASLPVSADMRSQVAYTDSVFTDRLVVVYRAATINDELSSPLELGGHEIHIESNSPAVLRLRNLQNESGDTLHLHKHSDLSGELIAMKVVGGDFDYGVTNEQIALDIQRKFPELKILPIGFTQFQAWAVAPADTVLLHRINGMLHRASAMQQTHELRRRYKL